MTHAVADHSDLHRDIATFVSGALDRIVSVKVGEDYDQSGDLFITILVAVNGSTGAYVRERPVGLLRALRAKLLSEGIDAFPSISFISTAEAA